MLLVQIHRMSLSPRRLNGRMPRDLETICLKCLEKKPDRRYETAADLAADLRAWLDKKAIKARPIGRLTRASAGVKGAWLWLPYRDWWCW